MLITYQASAVKLIGMPASEDSTVTFSVDNTVVPETTSTVTQYDAIKQYTVLSHSTPGYSMSLSPVSTYRMTTNTPGICSVTGTRITYVADGSGSVRIGTRYGTRDYPIQMTLVPPTTNISVTSYLSGSLSAHIVQTTNSYLVGKSSGTGTQNLWSSITLGGRAASMAAVPNPTRILPDADLSFISVQRSGRVDPKFPAYLVSPRHALIANHTWNALDVGEWIVFRRTDGTFIEAQVDSYTRINTAIDACILHFSSDLLGIAPARFLPANWANKLPSIRKSPWEYRSSTDSTGIPCFILSVNSSAGLPMGQHLQVLGVAGLSSSEVLNTNWAELSPNLQYPGFSSAPYGGDSSSPVFLPIMEGSNLCPILITSLFGAFSGPNFANMLPQIQSAMNALGAGYTLQTINLDSFTDYVA